MTNKFSSPVDIGGIRLLDSSGDLLINGKSPALDLNIENGAGENSIQQKTTAVYFCVNNYEGPEKITAREYLVSLKEIGLLETEYTAKEIRRGALDEQQFEIQGALNEDTFVSCGGTAVAEDSMALGVYSIAGGYSDRIMGQQCGTAGANNFIAGRCSACKDESISLGINNLTKSAAATTIGYQLKNTNKLYKQVFGKINKEATNSILEIGNGTEVSNPTSIRVDFAGSTNLNYGSQLTLNSPNKVTINGNVYTDCILEYYSWDESPVDLPVNATYENLQNVRFVVRKNAVNIYNTGRIENIYDITDSDDDKTLVNKGYLIKYVSENRPLYMHNVTISWDDTEGVHRAYLKIKSFRNNAYTNNSESLLRFKDFDSGIFTVLNNLEKFAQFETGPIYYVNSSETGNTLYIKHMIMSQGPGDCAWTKEETIVRSKITVTDDFWPVDE